MWGALAPPAELARQQAANGTWHALPANALYGLACVGAYYVIPEAVMFCKGWAKLWPRWPVAALAAAVLGGLFVLAPPMGNRFGVVEMGYLDKTLRLLGGDGVRLTILWALAVMGAVRFMRWHITSVLVLATVVIMIKSHLAWDKYTLSLLAVLWLCKSADADGEAICETACHGD